MINFNKGISTTVALTIIIVLAVVLIGGIFAYQYYYLPKQETETPKIETPKNETAYWKIYKNKEYGFEIKYPKDWEVNIEKDTTPQNDISIFFNKETTSGNLRLSLSVNKYAEIDTFRPPTKTEEIIVGGIKTTSYTYIFNDSDFLVIYGFCVDKNFKEVSPILHNCVLGSENFFYQFYLSCRGEDWQGEEGLKQCSDLFNKILSTFRFTE